MKIHTIKIRRIREIEELDIDCKDHSMIAIVGENGSGKTTIFFSLLFALTGELILKGKRDEHVRDTGAGPAWVEVTFEVHGKVCTVRRSMNTNTCTLTLPGEEKPIKGAKKVNAWMVEQQLYPARILQAFLPQGEADALFRATDAERAALCLRTFGLADIEAYDEALQKAIAPISDRIDDTLDDRLEEAAAQLTIAQQGYKQADVRLEKATENRSILRDAETVIRQAETRKAADSKRAEILALQERDTADKKQLEGEKASEQEVCDLRTQQVASTTDAYDKAKNTIYAADQSQQQAIQRVHVGQQLDQANQQLYAAEQELQQLALDAIASLPSLQEHLQSVQRQLEATRGVQTYLDRQEASQKRLSEAQAALVPVEAELAAKPSQEELQTDRKAFADQLALWRHQQANASDGRCGTCGQVWADVPAPAELAAQIKEGEKAIAAVDLLLTQRVNLERQIEHLRSAAKLASEAIEADEVEKQKLIERAGIVDLRDLQGLQSSQQEIEAKIQQAHQAKEQETAVRHRIALAEQQVKSLGDQLAALQTREITDSELADAKQLVEAYEAQKQEMHAAALRRDMLVKRIHDIEVRLVSYANELERICDVAEGEELDAELVVQAQAIIADTDAIHAEYDAAASEHAGIKREFEMFERQVAELTAKQRQQAADRKKLDVLRGARFILHREQLPRFVCSYYTEIVSEQWARELEHFNAKFTAWQDSESLEFYARFENGNERRVYQLSGGERQLAIVAYLRVRNRMFAPDLGIIGFDEPTTHVDEQFRPVIAEVFRGMAAEADKEDLQVFVVDHAPEFLAAIPAAIELHKSA